MEAPGVYCLRGKFHKIALTFRNDRNDFMGNVGTLKLSNSLMLEIGLNFSLSEP